MPENFAGFAEDKVNQLVLARVQSGKPLRYYVGAGWTTSGQFDSQQAWASYVAAEVARINSPVNVSLSD